ncbi:MAG: NADH-quinone oxidoreductase subunit H [Colwellia sp.]|nr:NADH-quinone oxidoreductase subunit H [Colwellia sp.]
MIIYILLITDYLLSILGHCNRVPFDLIEAESELIAGCFIEYSSIYFSIILLTEYANIIINTSLFTLLLFITSFIFL